MGSSVNAFALLADQQGKDASTIVALKTTELKRIAEKKKKIAEEKKKAEAKKKKKKKTSSARDGGSGREDQKSLDSNAVDQQCNGHDHTVKSTVDGQADQEHKAVSVMTVVLSEEKELCERWRPREEEIKKQTAERKEAARREERSLARERERAERRKWLATENEKTKRQEREERRLAREAEREERRLARERERKEQWEEKRKKEMAMKTLKEYEEQKAENATSSVPETPVTEVTLDNIYTKHKSKNGTVKKDSNIDKDGKSKDETVKKEGNIKKYWKVRKKMNVEEFLKLPTGREGQDDHGATDNQEHALPDKDNTVKVKAGPPDLSETSFPVLGKATKPTKY